ncbi:MAG TPA: hypothetical protein VLC06_14460 [Polyangia bacterium]|jgi:hypothetical protein|nr:hypothetical protein [Polyangia bacterium]
MPALDRTRRAGLFFGLTIETIVVIPVKSAELTLANRGAQTKKDPVLRIAR